jgi:hypothetical protein
MPEEDVVARLRAEIDDSFTRVMGQAEQSTSQVGEASQQAGAGAKKGAGGLLKAAAAAAVLYKGYGALKGAINTTTTLAKDTAGFARASGLSTKESQAWVVIAQQRGIATKQLQTGMATLGRNLGALGGSTKASSKMFQQLGLDQQRLLQMPMEQRMAAISDAFSKMPDGANKAALAQRVFGRAGQQLLPILNEGGTAMSEQLDAANKLVPPLGKTGKAALDMAKQQRTLKMAMTGVQVSVGSALVPILSKLATIITPIITKFTALLNKSPALTTAIIALAGALAAMMVINKLNALVTQFKNVTLVQAAASKIAAAAQWLWNAAMTANPVLLIVVALVALGAGLVLAYQKVGWFRNAVNAAFNAVKNVVAAVINWIKNNWKLLAFILLAPISAPLAAAGAAFYLLRNQVGAVFGAIKSAISSAVGFVGARVKQIVGFVTAIPGQVARVGSDMFKPIKTAITSAADWVKNKIQAIIGLVTKVVNEIKSIPAKVGGALSDAAGAVTSLPGKALGAINPFATGGIIAAQTGLNASRRTTALVGERGPELGTFPAGTRITPLPPPQLAASQLTGDGGRPMVAQVFLDRRMIAEAMASFAADQQAAR